MRFGGLQRLTLSDYPGRVAAVAFASGCNFRCAYCHNPALLGGRSEESPYTTRDVLNLLDRRRGKLNGLVISGGEPTLQRTLIPFSRQVKARGLAIKLDTNGSRPEVLRQLLEEELVDYVAMDIKAPLERYDSVAGAREVARAIGQSIELILCAAVDHEFRTTVVKPLLAEDDVVSIGCMLYGTARYVLQPFVPDQTLDPTLGQRASAFTAGEMGSLRDRLVGMGIPCSVRGVPGLA
jgi:pyruvate formate lyase activating enzyme